MKCGGLILNHVFRYSKWIALAAALFLLSANLDNVPDCPELLNSSSGPAASLQFVHHDVAARLDAVYVARETFRPCVINTQYVSDAVLAVSPPCVPQSLYQAADPSPPSAYIEPVN